MPPPTPFPAVTRRTPYGSGDEAKKAKDYRTRPENVADAAAYDPATNPTALAIQGIVGTENFKNQQSLEIIRVLQAKGHIPGLEHEARRERWAMIRVLAPHVAVIGDLYRAGDLSFSNNPRLETDPVLPGEPGQARGNPHDGLNGLGTGDQGEMPDFDFGLEEEEQEGDMFPVFF
jgi:hypothetical protein